MSGYGAVVYYFITDVCQMLKWQGWQQDNTHTKINSSFLKALQSSELQIMRKPKSKIMAPHLSHIYILGAQKTRGWVESADAGPKNYN